jgi:hypothetical protein
LVNLSLESWYCALLGQLPTLVPCLKDETINSIIARKKVVESDGISQ